GTVTISALGEGLLELVADPMWDSYVFEAELRQDLCLHGLVGIYVCDSRRTTPAGEEHSFWVMHFADHGVSAGRFQHYARRLRGPNSINSPRTKDELFTPTPGEWRKVKVKVTPDAIEVFWKGTAVRTISRAEIDSAAARLMTLDADEGLAPPAFTPRQSLGIY